MTAIDLAKHPVTPTTFGRWQPLNAPLEVTAFGISAIVCDPDEPFSIDHDETETGQQEAYIVVAGRARFTIGEDQVDAAPGEVVAVADPSLHRGFIALEPGTRIVCVVPLHRERRGLRRVDHRRRHRGRRSRPLATLR